MREGSGESGDCIFLFFDWKIFFDWEMGGRFTMSGVFNNVGMDCMASPIGCWGVWESDSIEDTKCSVH